jgi:arylsulfatase A-like enzyme
MSQRENLLFIWTDQQSAATLPIYGNTKIETPNLNRLASESVVFENAYVSQSVCGASRATIMTGQYPHTTGITENNVPLPSNTKCFPELGAFEEYETAFFGKWHLGDEIFRQHGFDQWISLEDQYRHFYSDGRPEDAHSTYHEFLVDEGFEPDVEEADGFKRFSREFCTTVPEEYTKPAYLAREATRFIEENRDKPFILYVMFLEPHQPYTSPRDDQYDPSDVELPANYEHANFDAQPTKVRLSREAVQRGIYNPPPELFDGEPTEEEWRQLISNYWGLVSLVDTFTGDILRTVESCGIEDRTITVYTSDHGDMLGSHQLLSKMMQFEEAIKVPLLLRIPGIPERKVERPVSQIDLVPTLLDAMGQSPPDHLQGHSWMPLLQDDGELVEENVFVEWNGPHANGINARYPLSWRPWNEVRSKPHPRSKYVEVWKEMADREDDISVMTEDEIMTIMTDPVRTVITPNGWKLNYRRSGEHELYNLDDDPHEVENLIHDSAHDELVTDLTETLFEWQKRHRDPVYL